VSEGGREGVREGVREGGREAGPHKPSHRGSNLPRLPPPHPHTLSYIPQRVHDDLTGHQPSPARQTSRRRWVLSSLRAPMRVLKPPPPCPPTHPHPPTHTHAHAHRPLKHGPQNHPSNGSTAAAGTAQQQQGGVWCLVFGVWCVCVCVRACVRARILHPLCTTYLFLVDYSTLVPSRALPFTTSLLGACHKGRK
jgi:hypothetical protein